MNPLVPSAIDMMFAALFVASVILVIGALVSLTRTAGRRSSTVVGWTLAIVFVPLLGAIAWFAVGKRGEQFQGRRA